MKHDIVPESERTRFEIGVIVGRFQLHELHEAHIDLIDNVVKNHKKVILFLGVSPVMSTRKNPLDFTSRKKMIEERYPDINILQLPDRRTDESWSDNLDKRVREVFPMGRVLLYGGRDSFIPHYKGNFSVTELEQKVYISGTEIRNAVSEEIKGSSLWRAGVIYQSYQRYPISYQTVDIALISDTLGLLLARKPNEDKYRFVGGFVDPIDKSLEKAAVRELVEETGGMCKVKSCKYLGSFRIDDWRYRSEMDKIMTAFFVAEYDGGDLEPSDDISEIKWFPFSEIFTSGFVNTMIVEEHRELMQCFINERHSILK
jgi:bifunctional NMN adenylyltransferase/nudix hydrolase